MVEPDSSRTVPTHSGPPRALGGPHALQILTTEHWSLLSARSLGYTEAMSRASIFIAALSGAVIALALVGQATDFGGSFVAFALVLLPVVFFLGVTTVIRLAQLNLEDATWVRGMNRIRHAYLELEPQLEPYFVTSRYDDDRGLLVSLLARQTPMRAVQPFIAVPGVVAVLDAVVAGAVAGVASLGFDVAIGWTLAIAGVAFFLALGAFAAWARYMLGRLRFGEAPRFPTPS